MLKFIAGALLVLVSMWWLSRAFALMNSATSFGFPTGIGMIIVLLLVWWEFLTGSIRRKIGARKQQLR